jgi:hypothetical protein
MARRNFYLTDDLDQRVRAAGRDLNVSDVCQRAIGRELNIGDEFDDRLNKLDQLLQRHHPKEQHQAPARAGEQEHQDHAADFGGRLDKLDQILQRLTTAVGAVLVALGVCLGATSIYVLATS